MSNYTDRVAHALEGLKDVSTGYCPSCKECQDIAGDSEDAYIEAGFSWSECGICGNTLGGNREVWHGMLDGRVVHFDDACEDCVVYLTNGEEQEDA